MGHRTVTRHQEPTMPNLTDRERHLIELAFHCLAHNTIYAEEQRECRALMEKILAALQPSDGGS